MKKLSAPQMYFLVWAKDVAGHRPPFLGNRHAGHAASAWHRTAHSLKARGLVTVERSGDSWTARITDAGKRVLSDTTEGER